jgi:hypothetical protein
MAIVSHNDQRTVGNKAYASKSYENLSHPDQWGFDTQKDSDSDYSERPKIAVGQC